MSVIDYITKMKEICDALGSINVMVDKDEMVQICLGGLAHKIRAYSDGYLQEGKVIVVL